MTDSFASILLEAGKIAQKSRDNLQFSIKTDGSIVTNGDKAVEAFLLKNLLPLEPGASFWGEEGGYEAPQPEGFWLVDPIDGTSNYCYGSPLWGVSVAFYKDDLIQYGGVYLPDNNELVIAENGKGATFNGEPIKPVENGKILEYELVACTESILRKVPLNQFPGKPRLSGSFVINGVYTALGRFRALLAAKEKLYDVAACIVIGREVGAEIHYLDGEAFLEKDLLVDRPIDRLWTMAPKGNQINYASTTLI